MGSLICLDLADGKILWKKDLFSKDSKDIPAELSNKLMRDAAAIASNRPHPHQQWRVGVFYQRHGALRLLRSAGQPEVDPDHRDGPGRRALSSSPIFVGDRLILSWGCLLALDAKDGKTLWKAADANRPTAHP